MPENICIDCNKVEISQWFKHWHLCYNCGMVENYRQNPEEDVL